jgi:TfoX/Sxy family transcriptional regulator of competence genes
MTAKPALVDLVLERLARPGKLRHRRMFGGVYL